MSAPQDNRSLTRAPTPGAPMPSAAPPPAALPVTSRTVLQVRAERMLVRAVPQVKYQLMRVGPAGLTGIGVLLAAAVAAIALLLPAHQSVLALRDELTKAGHAMPTTAKPQQSPQQFAASLPPTANRLARYTFEFPVKGDYGNIRSFINKSLAAIPALGLDKLHVERKNVGDTVVSADVGFVIYLRGA